MPRLAKPAASPRARLDALPPERQAVLLDPAEEEFADKGFAKASFNRILEAAGMSKGQAYYYVSDKADLYAAVIERAFARLVSAIALPAAPPGDAEAFWALAAEIFRQITALFLRDQRLAALARGIYDGPETQAALAAPMSRLRADLERFLATGQLLGAVRNDLPQSLLTGVLFAATREIDRWFAENFHALTPDEALAVNDRAVALIRAMAAPQKKED